MKDLNNTPKTFLKGITLTLLFAPFFLLSQSYEGLDRLVGYQTSVYYSAGSKERAENMAKRCDQVIAFYKNHLPFHPTVTLLVLAPQDWSKHTSFPVYGMPHYNDDKTLVVASENNDFWKSFIPPVDRLPAPLAHSIKSTYTDASGQLSMQPFFDLLAIHELGHAYHFQAGLTMQRRWMGELFANIFLHSYIAEKEADQLPALTIFPQMVVQSTDKSTLPFTSLQDLEAKYDEIGQKYPNNYGWYQCRWHMAAGKIYDAGKVEVFKKLWTALEMQKTDLDDASFTRYLGTSVHPSVADVPLKWDE